MSDNSAVALKISSGMLRSLDTEPFWAEFETRIPELFSTNGNCRVGILSSSNSAQQQARNTTVATQSGDNSAIELVSSLEELDAVLSRTSSPSSSRIFFLYRYNSWSRMDISLEMFETLYTTTHIAPQFLKVVMGLGRKISSRDESFMSCYTHLTPSRRSRQGDRAADRKPVLGQSAICYNIRYFERHGRSLDDPWSCRQSAIHQNYNMDKDRSDWVTIQAPLRFTSNFKGEHLNDSHHPMYLHTQYLATCVGDWREYLNYSSDTLKTLNEEIVVCKPYGEYGIGFSSRQQVHALRLKLHHARSILANTLNTIKTIRMHEETIAKLCNLPVPIQQEFQRELGNISTELQNHEQTVQELLSVSQDIGRMYDGVLKYHGQELLHRNSLRLTQIAQNDADENRTMAVLAEKTFHDSRTVRIATVIAMFYLPANLVISFFSTTLIWFDNSGQTFSLRIHQEVWIAVLTTLVLIVGTKMLSWWWERYDSYERKSQRTSQQPVK
ncbi:hypothetical protein F4808DRAFT_358368 [Astrocystis sublimbata]|nr:hypothetical protein F4808DRAFT_358368 [Astrocystis sublimbata]